MPVGRPLDHLVLCVRDLDAARPTYERLGFTLTPKATHPFGTANSLVQLHGNFLELLTVVDRRLIKPVAQGEFAFAAFNERFLVEREGMSMLVFASDDARRDQREFAASGLETYAPFDFSRLARLPDGSDATEAMLRGDGMAVRRAGATIQFGPAENFGVIVEFAEAAG